jgi:hypothetical protein
LEAIDVQIVRAIFELNKANVAVGERAVQLKNYIAGQQANPSSIYFYCYRDVPSTEDG